MNTYRVEVSIYGGNSGWKRSLVTSVVVKADDKEGAVAAVLADPQFPNLKREDIYSVSVA